MKKLKFKNNTREKIKTEYSNAIDFIVESKKYIYSIIAVFSFFTLIGFFIPIPEEIVAKIMVYFKELLEQTKDYGLLEMIGFLFNNNIIASFFGMIFGAFFGIFSIFNAILNGFILGFAASMSVTENGLWSLWRILPHGIFELPALFLSLGMGLRLGLFIFEKKTIKGISKIFKKSLKTFIVIIVPLLLLAAIIEGILIIFSK